jgi:hypothetical protein
MWHGLAPTGACSASMAPARSSATSATRADCRRRGVAGAAVRRAAEEIRDAYAADFALLFCEPRLAPVYQSLGWHLFAGEVFVTQPRGRVRFDVTDPHALDLKIAPRSGVIDLCGLPW